ncbi:hypothetical protein CLV46_1134 [Diaminobutyricimonas aerilata]|uniref:Uncharacterized protein n=1 Tax=Diaminobutyricimonas aerilata TaxID=1162967 RepID=A0A2M9CI91_9MICO|nr:hypothetical protein CLV46_1134 [Diaminobutyricimonas aerilata]
MNFELLFLGAVSAWAITASIVSIARDGYRRIPTRHA